MNDGKQDRTKRRKSMRRMARVMALALAVGLVAPLVGAVPAMAGPTPHMMTGKWVGFSQGGDSADFCGALVLEVTSQDGRRFEGTVAGIDCPDYRVEGTVSESGQVTMVGRSGASHVVIQGDIDNPDVTNPEDSNPDVTDPEVTNPDVDNPDLLEGRFALTGPAGQTEGELRLLRVLGWADEREPQGGWEGYAQFVDNPEYTPIAAQFTRGRTGEGTGQLTLGDSRFDVAFELGSGDEPGFVLVGGGADGLLVMLGRYLPPDPCAPTDDCRSLAGIAGNLRFIAPDGPDLEAAFQVQPSA